MAEVTIKSRFKVWVNNENHTIPNTTSRFSIYENLEAQNLNGCLVHKMVTTLVTDVRGFADSLLNKRVNVCLVHKMVTTLYVTEVCRCYNRIFCGFCSEIENS